MKQRPLALRLRAAAALVLAVAAGAGPALAKDSRAQECLRQCTPEQLRQHFSASRVQGVSPAMRSQWLAAAISQRRLDAVQALLAAGVDANHPYRFDAGGEMLSATPLMQAVSARAGLPISQALVAAVREAPRTDATLECPKMGVEVHVRTLLAEPLEQRLRLKLGRSVELRRHGGPVLLRERIGPRTVAPLLRQLAG